MKIVKFIGELFFNIEYCFNQITNITLLFFMILHREWSSIWLVAFDRYNLNVRYKQFQELCKYTRGDIKPDNEVQVIQSIIGSGINREELRDEIFVQCMRQATNNPNTESTERVWLLICLAIVAFQPSKLLYKVNSASVLFRAPVYCEITSLCVCSISSVSCGRICKAKGNSNSTSSGVSTIARTQKFRVDSTHRPRSK